MINTNLLLHFTPDFSLVTMMEEFPRTHVHPMYIACIDRMIPEFLRGVLPERRKIHGDGSRVNPACYRATQIFLRANPPSSFLAQRFISTKSRIKIGLRKGRYLVGWNFTDLDESSMRETSI